MIAYFLVSLAVALVGMLVYALSTNAKLVELGRIAYACGLLVTLFVLSQHMVRFPS